MPPLEAIFFLNECTGWVVGANGTIGKTTDGGFSWEARTCDQEQLLAVHFIDDNNGWAVGGAGAVCATTDGGLTWTVEQPPSELFDPDQSKTLFGVHVTESRNSRVRAVGQNATILRSNEGGTGGWERLGRTHLTGVYSIREEPVDGEPSHKAWMVGYDGTILHTRNLGVAPE